MKKLVITILLFSCGAVHSNESFQTVEEVPSVSLSVIYNIAKCITYVYRMRSLVDTFEKTVSNLPKDEKVFLQCTNCKNKIPAKNVLSEFLADTIEAVYKSDLFKKYCKVIDKMFIGMKASDYQAFASCALDAAEVQKKICEQCNQSSWTVMQHKKLKKFSGN